MKNCRNFIIFGAGGFLGKHLMDALHKTREKHFLGTGINHIPADHGMYFNFLQQTWDDLPLDYRIPGDRPAAVICSAISRIDLCRTLPESYRINVTKTVELCCRLADVGYHVCFISTDHVFDGKRGGYVETDAVNPINAYGQQKAETESLLQQKIPERLLIARLSKQVCTFRDPANVFTQWEQKMYQRQSIHHIKGMDLSFTDAQDTAEVLLALLQQRICGVFHVCGKEHWTRSALCKEFLSAKGWLTAETAEIPLEEFHFQDDRPLKTWLKSDKLHQAIPVKFKKMKDVVKLYIRNVGEKRS